MPLNTMRPPPSKISSFLTYFNVLTKRAGMLGRERIVDLSLMKVMHTTVDHFLIRPLHKRLCQQPSLWGLKRSNPSPHSAPFVRLTIAAHVVPKGLDVVEMAYEGTNGSGRRLEGIRTTRSSSSSSCSSPVASVQLSADIGSLKISDLHES